MTLECPAPLPADEPRTAAEVIERARLFRQRKAWFARHSLQERLRREAERREAERQREERRLQQEREALRATIDQSARWFSEAHDEIDAARMLTAAHIMAAVADAFGVTVADLKSHHRSHRVTVPRQIAMWLVDKRRPLSLPAIGKLFGNRDHTTVLHAVRKIQGLADRGELLDVCARYGCAAGHYAYHHIVAHSRGNDR